ncbi:hypothetical protein COB52_05825 [Candidatus Kaiserbacteria bacterium]|nr:MAG: hypothetical protein COB52_05825 [Candidatus Kaiserbacteria bacterium]
MNSTLTIISFALVFTFDSQSMLVIWTLMIWTWVSTASLIAIIVWRFILKRKQEAEMERFRI